jgi:hypothetical protein
VVGPGGWTIHPWAHESGLKKKKKQETKNKLRKFGPWGWFGHLMGHRGGLTTPKPAMGVASFFFSIFFF